MPQRRSELAEPLAKHTRDYYERLSHLLIRHPHMSRGEIELFMNKPVANEAPAAPSKPAPSSNTMASMASKIWPHLASSKEK
jgi:hypothetical protein